MYIKMERMIIRPNNPHKHPEVFHKLVHILLSQRGNSYAHWSCKTLDIQVSLGSPFLLNTSTFPNTSVLFLWSWRPKLIPVALCQNDMRTTSKFKSKHMPCFRNPFQTLQELHKYTHPYTKIPLDPRTSPAIRLLTSTNSSTHLPCHSFPEFPTTLVLRFCL